MIILDIASRMGIKTRSSRYLRANFRRLKAFARGVIKAFKVSRKSVRIAFIASSSGSRILFNFNTRSKRVMMKSINRLRQKRGKLNLAVAIKRSRQIFASARRDASRVLLIITAGKSRGRLRSESLSTQRLGVTIIPIGVLPMIDQTELSTMSSPPAGANRMAINFLGLMNIISIVVNKIVLGMSSFFFSKEIFITMIILCNTTPFHTTRFYTTPH